MKPKLTIKDLIASAKDFCEIESEKNHTALIGTTDGKKVGTYIERQFAHFLQSRYEVEIGNSAEGLDLPGSDIQTDIKATSIIHPQSSCPYKNADQKIYGLGYNLLIFAYLRQDTADACFLKFVNCTFISQERTGDYTTTFRLREMIQDGANRDDIAGFLEDKGLPGDEDSHYLLADRILSNPPLQGYLTISSALQWRLQYTRAISLDNHVAGVTNYAWAT